MKLFIPLLVLFVLIETTCAERTLDEQNANDALEPTLSNVDGEDAIVDREPSKRTIGSRLPLAVAKHVTIDSLGHKHVFGYGPVDYKYMPVIKPVVLKPVAHAHLVKPLRLRPVAHYLPSRPARRPFGHKNNNSNGWRPNVPPNVPLPPKPHYGPPASNGWHDGRPSISLQPPVAGSGQHGVRVRPNPDVDVRPAVVPDVPSAVPLEPTPEVPVQPVHPVHPAIPDQPHHHHHLHPVFPQPGFPQPVFPPPIAPQPVHPHAVFPQHAIHPEPVPVLPYTPHLVPLGNPEHNVFPLGAAFNPDWLHAKAVVPQPPVHPIFSPHPPPHHPPQLPPPPHGFALPHPPLPVIPNAAHPISVVPPPALGPHPAFAPGHNFLPGSAVFHGNPGLLPSAPGLVPQPLRPTHPAFVPAQQPGAIPAPPDTLPPSAFGAALPPFHHQQPHYNPHGVVPPSIHVDQPPFIGEQPHQPVHPVHALQPQQPVHPVHPVHALQPHQPVHPVQPHQPHDQAHADPYPLPKPSGVEFHGKAAHLVPLSNPVAFDLPDGPAQEPFNYHAKEQQIPHGHFIPGVDHLPPSHFNVDAVQQGNFDGNGLAHHHQQQQQPEEQQPGVSIQPGQTDIQLPFHLPNHPTFHQQHQYQHHQTGDGQEAIGATDANFSGYVR